MSFLDTIMPGDFQEIFSQAINELSLQSDNDFLWQEGRTIDMNAFDKLPRELRDFINDRGSFYPIEDVLYEFQHDHRGDWELTLVWLLEAEDIGRGLDAHNCH